MQWLVGSKDATKVKVSHWSVDIAPAKCISKWSYSGRPSTHSPQNASTVQLGVSQPIYGAAVMCRPAHGCPVLTFVPSANNCRSEHINRMLLFELAVTTKQLQKENIWSDFGEGLYAKCLSFFLLLNISKFWIVPRFGIYVRESHFGIREKKIISNKYSVFY